MLFSSHRWFLRRIGRTIASLAVMTFLILSCAESRAADLTAEWDDGDGDWTDSTHWSTTNFPNNTLSTSYDVSMAAGTIDLDTTPSIKGLFQSGGTITSSSGGSTLFLNDDSQWSGGTLDKNTLFFMNPVTWTLDGGAKTFSGGAQLSYGEDATVTTNWTSGDITLSGGSVWNTGGGTFNVDTSGGDLAVLDGGGGTNRFVNAGIFNKTGDGTAEFATRFDNGGQIARVLGGTLVLSGGGDHGGGTFRVEGGTLDFAGGVHAFTNGSVGTVGTDDTVIFSGGSTTFDATSAYSGQVTRIEGGTVVFNNDESTLHHASTRHLQLSTGTIGGSGEFLIGPRSSIVASTPNPSVWSGGSVVRTGATIVNDILELSGGTKTFGAPLESNASINWTSGDLHFSGGTWTHNGSADRAFSIETDADMLSNSGTNVFDNQGALTKQTTSGITTIEPVFNNSGTVEVQTGTLQISGGGTSTGAFSVAADARLEFAAGTFDVEDGGFTGAGEVVFSGATFNMGELLTSGTNYNVDNTVVQAGTVTFRDPVTTKTWTQSGGTAGILNSDFSLEIFEMSGGTLEDSSSNSPFNIAVSGAAAWSGGTIRDEGTVTFSDTLALSGDTHTVHGKREVITLAPTTWTGGDIVFEGAGPGAADETVWSNQHSLSIETDADLLRGTAPGATRFSNIGSVVKTPGTGETLIDVGFDNQGTFEVQGGIVTLGGSGSQLENSGDVTLAADTRLLVNGFSTLRNLGSIVGDGTFEVDRSGQNLFSNGTDATYDLHETILRAGAADFTADGTTNKLTIHPDGRLTGSGGLQIGEFSLLGGSVSGSGNHTTQSFVMTSGTLSGTGNFMITGDSALWLGGQMFGSGITTFAGSLDLRGVSEITSGRTINTQGDTTFEFGREISFVNGGVWNNSGNFIIERQTEITASGSNNQFVNTGTFSKTSSTADTTTVAAPFTNSGAVEVSGAAAIDFAGGFTQTDGTLALVGGATVSSPQPFEIQGGAVEGTGAIVGDVNNSGTIRPDLQIFPDRKISVEGDLTLGSGSILDLSFGPNGVGGRAQRLLEVTGAFTAGGNLQLGLGGTTNPFGVGDTYTLATAGGGIFGAFDNFASGAVFSEGEILANIHYGAGSPFDPNALVFEVTQAAPLTAIWNGTDSNWTSSSRWSTADFPNNVEGGERYNAVINSGRVTLNQDIEVTRLTLGSHLFPANGSTLTITDEWNWTAGHINASGDGGALVSQGQFTLTNSDAKLQGVPLLNAGDAQFVGRGIRLESGSTFTNEGSLNVTSSGTNHNITVFSSGTVINDTGAVWTVDTPGTATVSSGSLHNRGLLRVLDGDFTLSNVIGGTSSGTIELAGGSMFTISNGEGRRYDVTGSFAETAPGATFYKDGRGSVWLRAGSSYDVTNTIIHEGALIMDEPATLVNLEMHSRPGIRNGSAEVHVTGHFDWQGGRFGGTAANNSLGDTGGTTILDPGSTTLIHTTDGKNIQNHSLTNQGTVTYERGQVSISSGGIFRNEGTLNAVGDGLASSYRIFSGSTVNNAAGGLMVIDTGAAADFDAGAFNNSGTLRVDSGNFALNNVVSGTSSGAIEVVGGSTFTISNGDGRRYDIAGTLMEIGPGATFYKDGRGSVRLMSGSVYDVTNTIIHEGALIMDEPATLVNLEMHSRPGIRNGSADVHVTGHFDWLGGRFGGSSGGLGDTGGTTILDPGSTTLIQTTDGKNITNHTLINQGTVTYERGQVSISGGIFRNEGTLNAVGDGAASSYRIFSGSTVNNAASGLIVIDTGAAAEFDAGAFNNSGTLRVASGDFALSNVVSGTSSGEIEVAGGSIFTISNGRDRRYDIASTLVETAPGATFFKDGGGAVRFQSGSTYDVTNTVISQGAIVFDTTTTLSNVTLGDGIRNGSADVHVTGHFDWQGGRFGGSPSLGDTGGTTILDAGSTTLIHTTAEKTIFNHTLINHGDMVWQAGNISHTSSSFENHGTLDIQGNTSWTSSGAGFLNTGSITKSAGTGQALIGPTVTSSGDVAVEAGTLRIDKLIQNDGTSQVAAGATLLSFNRIDINGGSIGGAGTVQGQLRVRGELTPGASVGQLNVDGDLEFSGSPTYLWELDAAGGDLVHVSGNLNFGTGAAPVLDISHLGGDLSGTHTILTYDGAAPTNQPAWTIQAGGAGGAGSDAHFINPAGGSWETAANWDTPETVTGGSVVYAPGELQVTGVTVGKNAPAAGSNIFIDADGVYTVTGLAAGIDINSLAIGTQNSGTATLRLMSANDVVRGTTTVASGGQLHLTASHLDQQGELSVTGGFVRIFAGSVLTLGDDVHNDTLVNVLEDGELRLADDISFSGSGYIGANGGKIAGNGETRTLSLGQRLDVDSLALDAVILDGAAGGEITYFGSGNTLTLAGGAKLQNVTARATGLGSVLTISAIDGGLKDVTNLGTVFVSGQANGKLSLEGTVQAAVRLTSDAHTRAEVSLIGPVTLGSFSKLTFTGSGENAVFSTTGDALTMDAGSSLLVNPNAFGAIGTHVINGGRISVLGSGSLELASLETSGPVQLNEGTLTAQQIDILPGGRLTGVGDVFGDIHNLGGTVAPGFSPGVIEVFGNYFQGADGLLEMEFAGTGVGQFDVLQVTGDVDLQGTVLLSFIDGFAPSEGDVFQFMLSDSEIDMTQAAFQIMNLEPGFLYDLDSAAGVLQMTALNDGVSLTNSNLVPEPQSAVMALIALLVMWVAVRVSHRKRDC